VIWFSNQGHKRQLPIVYLPIWQLILFFNIQTKYFVLKNFLLSLDTMASSVTASLMGSSMASSVPTAVEEVSEEGLPIITLEEVKNHFSLQDAWMVVYDRVYNVTSFLAEVCNN
jgi:hypothetical protein